MEVIITNSADEMSKKGAELVAAAVKKNPKAVLGLATGGTPVKMYAELIKLYKSGALDFKKVRSFNLDEYVGLPGTHDQSYRCFMNENLFNHINIDKKNTNVPDGLAKDIEKSCAEYEAKIKAWGGIDLQVLGIGSNGHIAFNEPLSGAMSKTRKVAISQRTIADNARFFKTMDEVPKTAVTMGIGTILEARKIVLLASGGNKADVIAAAVEGPVTQLVPASFLQLHADTVFVVEKEAASKLKGKY